MTEKPPFIMKKMIIEFAWLYIKNPKLADTDLPIMETSGVVQGVSQLIPIKHAF